eukprot:752071-Hanusia_phi.AAC.2
MFSGLPSCGFTLYLHVRRRQQQEREEGGERGEERGERRGEERREDRAVVEEERGGGRVSV